MTNAIVLAALTDTWPYVIAGWVVAFGGIAAFALTTVLRGRRLSRQVPPEKRRWS